MAISLLNALLPVWILIAMTLGILLGFYSPSARVALNSLQIVSVSLPTFIGLLLMLYPPLCDVKYERLRLIFKQKHTFKNLAFSITINWIVAPLFMLALAWACLFDQPHLRTGLIIVGIARCIAMVLIWNKLANGDQDWCAILVALNAILQLVLFSPLAYIFTTLISQSTVIVDIWLVTRSVLIFLGIPLAFALITRVAIRPIKPEWYDKQLMPFIGPISLVGLLFTILVMFTLQGDRIINDIGSVFRVALPLVIYFSVVFFGTLYACLRIMHIPYDIAITQSFTAAGNNFELAIAVCVASFGIDSQEAFASVIGPLIEVPVLLSFVHAALWLRPRSEIKQNPLLDIVEDEEMQEVTAIHETPYAETI